MTHEPTHLAFATITELVEQRLAPAEAAQARAHLVTCARCTQDLVYAEELVGIMQEDAPPALVQRAVNLFRVRPQQAPQPSLLARIRAALSYDSRSMQPALGFRDEQSAERQLLFHTDTHDIDLRVAPAADGWLVTGQILGDCDCGEVELQGPQGSVRATLSEFCEFTFPPLPAGTYAVLVYLPDLILEVADLAIGQ